MAADQVVEVAEIWVSISGFFGDVLADKVCGPTCDGAVSVPAKSQEGAGESVRVVIRAYRTQSSLVLVGIFVVHMDSEMKRLINRNRLSHEHDTPHVYTH